MKSVENAKESLNKSWRMKSHKNRSRLRNVYQTYSVCWFLENLFSNEDPLTTISKLSMLLYCTANMTTTIWKGSPKSYMTREVSRNLLMLFALTIQSLSARVNIVWNIFRLQLSWRRNVTDAQAKVLSPKFYWKPFCKRYLGSLRWMKPD